MRTLRIAVAASFAVVAAPVVAQTPNAAIEVAVTRVRQDALADTSTFAVDTRRIQSAADAAVFARSLGAPAKGRAELMRCVAAEPVPNCTLIGVSAIIAVTAAAVNGDKGMLSVSVSRQHQHEGRTWVSEGIYTVTLERVGAAGWRVTTIKKVMET